MKVQVLLPKIFDFTFTYACEQKKDYKVGDIVEIPFGSKSEIGVIWSDKYNTNKNNTTSNTHSRRK